MSSEARNRAHTLFSASKFGLLKALGLALLVFAGLASPRSTQAKLDPYYILRGQSFGQFKPRVLFALDTSGSMTWKPVAPDQYAVRPEVEGEDASKASRIHGARRAIHKVIDQTQDQASFSLMTFGHVKPPQSAGQVPTKCNYGGVEYRFWWTTYTQMGGGWQPIWNDFGSQGTWQLCGDNRGFAYLRHDDLGGFSMPDDEAGDPPPAPLVKSVADEDAFKHGANWSRKVQFFPQFLGVRRNLDCNDASDKSILDRSFGDYGNGSPARENNICGRDFYYWPYVDGFPGYSHFFHYSPWAASKVECDVYENCSWWNDRYFQAGTNRRTYSYHATLFAPFYSKAVIDSMAIPQSEKGPKTKEDAVDLALGLTGDTDEGGIDAHHGTPWSSAVGNADTYWDGNGPKLANIPQTNAPFGHTDIASYLAFTKSVSAEDLCVPTVAVLISDGQPSPGEGGSTLHGRLAKLRKVLDVKTYVVGFSDGFLSDAGQFKQLQDMACAAAGSDSTWSPCTGNNSFDWDTCADPDDPANGCAWEASDPDQLADALIEIVNGAIEMPVPAGPGASSNEFVPNQNDPNQLDPIQTTITGYTETPSWKGHVIRGACDTIDPDTQLLEEFCQKANDPLLPEDDKDEEDFSDGGQTGCGFSRTWDAGECLQQKAWTDRRIYASDANNVVYRISQSDGSATAKFKAELDALGLLSPGKEQQEADEIAAFLLGKNAPDGWKLSGLATSTPIVVRRIPQPNQNLAPTVGIRDPHCAGRLLGANQNELPDELETFATQAWEPVPASGSFAAHREYAEAVLVGTDMGLLHAFHFDSGNELFAYLPQNLLPHVAELAANGPDKYGQPAELENHRFGISSTINQGWAWDEKAGAWRHLAVLGFGKGGTEYVALDLSHMARLENGDPIEVLWTTWTVADAGWKTAYEKGLGQTWSRPALTYAVPDGGLPSIAQNPKAYLVFASGYPENVAETYQGHTLFMVDAVSGETSGEIAYFPAPGDPSKLYDQVDDYALVPDPAVATYCESGYWGEMQETYIADPYGQLFRWDLGADLAASFPPHHEADSVLKWADNGNVAEPLFQFKACQGTGVTCSITSNNRGDVFTFSPAVVSKDRIDELSEAGQALGDERKDELLIALNSGSANDEAIDGGDDASDFHSSLYLMVDDHQDPTPKTDGLDIPGIGGTTLPGDHASFMRLPLSEIERTREWVYGDGSPGKDQRKFSKQARPISAPRIDVTGLTKAGELFEIYYVTYVIYEPGEQTCDPRWYDEDAEEWVFDFGSTYEVTFRIDTRAGEDFDFINGTGVLAGEDLGDGFGSSGSGLQQKATSQILDGDCADGNCGPVAPPAKNKPCDPNDYGGSANPSTTVPMGWSELDGFSPLEIPLP